VWDLEFSILDLRFAIEERGYRDHLTWCAASSNVVDMKKMELELPDGVAEELEKLVTSGFYLNTQEAIRHALKVFLQQHASALSESQQLNDIAWALREVSSA